MSIHFVFERERSTASLLWQEQYSNAPPTPDPTAPLGYPSASSSVGGWTPPYLNGGAERPYDAGGGGSQSGSVALGAAALPRPMGAGHDEEKHGGG